MLTPKYIKSVLSDDIFKNGVWQMPDDDDIFAFCLELRVMRRRFQLATSTIASSDRNKRSAISHLSAARDDVEKVLDDHNAQQKPSFLKEREAHDQETETLAKMLAALRGFVIADVLKSFADRADVTVSAEKYSFTQWHQIALEIFRLCKELLETVPSNAANNDLGLSKNGPLTRFSAKMIHCVSGDYVVSKTVFNQLQGKFR